MDEQQIKNFWEEHPCGDHQAGGLRNAHAGSYEAFFRAYDEFRYSSEAHIVKCLDAIQWSGKNVLEIGLGQGAESEQLIKRGARWSGLDLTAEAVERVRTRLKLRQLTFDNLKQGSALDIPYPSNSFDVVFSHGVLHHIPDITRAQQEIARVLRPNGELVMMVYAKWSINYLVSIAIVRRLALLILWMLRLTPQGIVAEHVKNARDQGILQYLKMENFIHRNTDGPANPYSKVYDLGEVEKIFTAFRVIRSYKRLMHAPPLPVALLPLESQLGWHLWVHLRPIK